MCLRRDEAEERDFCCASNSKSHRVWFREPRDPGVKPSNSSSSRKPFWAGRGKSHDTRNSTGCFPDTSLVLRLCTWPPEESLLPLCPNAPHLSLPGLHVMTSQVKCLFPHGASPSTFCHRLPGSQQAWVGPGPQGSSHLILLRCLSSHFQIWDLLFHLKPGHELRGHLGQPALGVISSLACEQDPRPLYSWDTEESVGLLSD